MVSPVEGVVQLLILIVLLAFVFPIRGEIISKELKNVRKLAVFVVIGYLVLSLLPYAITTTFIQAYIGLVIAFNIINGVVGGIGASI